MEYLKRTWAEINLDALIHNLNLIKKQSGARIAAVIKADAYGHGATKVSALMEKEGVDMFAVSNIDEAMEIRNAGIKSPILILGYTPVHYTEALAKHNIIQTVYSLEYAKNLAKRASILSLSINCHLKLDTGMTRLGFDCRSDELSGISDMLECLKLPCLNICGAYTHFATADFYNDEDGAFTDEQYNRFLKATALLEENGATLSVKHCCNSAGILYHESKHEMLTRPGIVLYGLTPSADLELPIGLKPVMTFKSKVSLVKKISKGDAISYGRNFIATEDMTVATVSVGYADGYPRKCGNRAYVLINGKRARVIGNVCMDQMIIDVTSVPDVRVDDEVILFGEELPVEEVAAVCDTINYEIVCGISRRVPRVYIKDGKESDIVNYIVG